MHFMLIIPSEEEEKVHNPSEDIQAEIEKVWRSVLQAAAR